MKRPLRPARVPTAEEEKRERRFTRRLMILALAGGLFGGVVQLGLRTMGRPAMPRPPGAAPPPQLPPAGELEPPGK